MKRFNINDNIIFKPTAIGLVQWEEDWERYGTSSGYSFEMMLKGREVKGMDGFYYIQFWEFCQIFGSNLSLGLQTPTETTVYFEDADLVDV